MKKLRIIAILLTSSLLCILLSGCYDRKEVDDMTYIIAIGVDKGKSNNIKLTLQYAVPLAMGVGSGGEGGGGSKSLSTLTLECPTIYAGFNMANNFVGKEINVSHAKVIVFSQELAKEGIIGRYMHSFARNRDIRPSINVAIALESAEDYIKSIKPIQEVDPAKYYELKFNTYTYAGFLGPSKLVEFYSNLESLYSQASAPLVAVGGYKSSDEFSANSSTYASKGHLKPLEGDYYAGNLPKAGDIKGETMGIAVFDGVRMSGKLDGEEATYILMATGKFGSSYVTVPDPLYKNMDVVLNLKQSRKPSFNVEFVNGKPKINLNLRLEADFVSIQSDANYEESKRGNFEKSTEDFIKHGMVDTLNKTVQLRSDICGFGSSVKKKMLTWKEWENFNWFEKYKDATFNVNVDFKVRRPGLILRSSPFFGSEGEDKSK